MSCLLFCEFSRSQEKKLQSTSTALQEEQQSTASLNSQVVVRADARPEARDTWTPRGAGELGGYLCRRGRLNSRTPARCKAGRGQFRNRSGVGAAVLLEALPVARDVAEALGNAETPGVNGEAGAQAKHLEAPQPPRRGRESTPVRRPCNGLGGQGRSGAHNGVGAAHLLVQLPVSGVR